MDKHVQKSCGPFEEWIEDLRGWSAEDIGAECCEIKVKVKIRNHGEHFGLHTKGDEKLLKGFKLGLGDGGS